MENIEWYVPENYWLLVNSHLSLALEESLVVISLEAPRFDGNTEKHTSAKQLA